jgi:putative copper export protein
VVAILHYIEIIILIIKGYSASIENTSGFTDRPSNKNSSALASSLLYVALIAGAISIFSNSITSHNAGVHFLPSLSISLDWVHFMAVSIWVGGLFYISSVLITAIRTRATTTITTMTDSSPNDRRAREPISDDSKSRSVFLYYLALLLPRFSLLATVSLGVIGVSGLYMAWIQLHSLNSLFTTAYGNILIVKLSAALPLVLLGAYHQLRLHRSSVLVASLGQRRGRKDYVDSTITSGSGKESSTDNNAPVSQTFSNNYVGDINNKNNKYPLEDKGKIKDIPSRFSKTIKIESLLAMGVLLAASLLTITSPPAMNTGISSMAASMSSSSSSMSGMSMTPTKNSTYTIQAKILNVNTKLEINPFYSGFNTFKVTFTDTNGKSYTKVNAAEMTFTNTVANIGPIVANLHGTGPGVFSITGAYISQPGEWDIALAAQRVQDLDLNDEFTAKVTNAHSVSQGGSTASTTLASAPVSLVNSMQEAPPLFDSFAWLAIALAAAVVLGSTFYDSRSKKELRKTIEILKFD